MELNILNKNYQKPVTPKTPPRQTLTQTDLPSGLIQPRAIKPGYFLTRFGVGADRPATPSRFEQVYFATDTGVLSMWNGSSWLDATLS